VLDEATNSLDGDTESEVTSAIMGLRSKVTVILIAHRLSTVKNVDQIVYLKNGKILAKGSFDQVCLAVPDFQKNFKLMDQL
jgi:ABC-type bacteriocin/lantibiotic exporter with double-glycine peptidase domain